MISESRVPPNAAEGAERSFNESAAPDTATAQSTWRAAAQDQVTVHGDARRERDLHAVQERAPKDLAPRHARKLRNVNCLTCHSVHSSDPRSPHLVAKPQLALCGTCHTQAASMRNKPYAHRLDRGGMTCSSCHEPHGRRAKGERSLALTGHLRTTRAGEAPCLSCHTEKRGPFVFQHGGTEVGECTTCHQPHGSSNPKMLARATVQQVCLECPPTGVTSDRSRRRSTTIAAALPNCTTCHWQSRVEPLSQLLK